MVIEESFSDHNIMLTNSTVPPVSPAMIVTGKVFHDIYEASTAFLNSSVGIQSANSSVCFGNISAFNSSVHTLFSQINHKAYDKIGYTLQAMVASVDPITEACYFSVFDYYKIFNGYLLTIINVNELTYNVIHNMGNIYDATTNLIDNIRFGDPTTSEYWHRMGTDVGNIVA